MVMREHRENGPIYARIAEELRQRIAAGVLQPGDKLPSVRELAAERAINPNTIQRAYRELEAAGWVTSEAGRGCYVREIPRGGEREDLLQTFDDTVDALRAMGITTEELMARLERGGTDHA